MAGPFSGHLLNSFQQSVKQEPNQSMANTSFGSVSFNPHMHGNQSFSFGSPNQSMGFSEGMSEETAMRVAHLQAKLNQRLGPEYISQRPGGGGMRLTYAEGWKIINLANEVFGFNGWSTSVVNLTTDFIDASEGGSKFNICVTAMVRVTLRDGVYHEDVGCGTVENIKSKAQGLDKCKKEAVTDAVKRALRNFGNLMGNCLYDKSYTQEVVKMKVQPPKFDKSQLHRRPEFEESNVGASTSTSKPTPAPTTTNAVPSSSTSRPPPPPPQNQYQQPQRNYTSGSAQVKTEPQASTIPPNPQRPNNTTYDPKGKAPQRPAQAMAPPSNPAPRAPPEPQPDARRVSFQDPQPEAQVATSSSVTLSDPDDMESFGFSDDDALFASVCLEGIGQPIAQDEDRPIAEEADMGKPLEYDTTTTAGSTTSLAASTSSRVEVPVAKQPEHQRRFVPSSDRPTNRMSSARLEAIIAAELENQKQQAGQGVESGVQNPPSYASGRITLRPSNGGQPPQNRLLNSTNENRNPNGNQTNAQSTRTNGMGDAPFEPITGPTAMGGFSFPPGMVNQGNNGGPPVAIGMKRPVEMISNQPSRTGRPGMGLEQAHRPPQPQASNGRQVLGRIDNGDGGDVKRMRY